MIRIVYRVQSQHERIGDRRITSRQVICPTAAPQINIYLVKINVYLTKVNIYLNQWKCSFKPNEYLCTSSRQINYSSAFMQIGEIFIRIEFFLFHDFGPIKGIPAGLSLILTHQVRRACIGPMRRSWRVSLLYPMTTSKFTRDIVRGRSRGSWLFSIHFNTRRWSPVHSCLSRYRQPKLTRLWRYVHVSIVIPRVHERSHSYNSENSVGVGSFCLPCNFPRQNWISFQRCFIRARWRRGDRFFIPPAFYR